MFMQDITRLSPFAPAVAAAPVTTGLTAGTLVETRHGWRPVEALCTGDHLQTLDGGLRPVLALDRAWLLPGMAAGVLHLPGGAFGNCDAVTLLPGQHLLTDLTRADAEAGTGDLPDALAALLPAAALDGFGGARLGRVASPLEVITPVFAEEELLWAASGLLLHCPGTVQAAPADGFFPTLTPAAARRLLAARAGESLALPGWVA